MVDQLNLKGLGFTAWEASYTLLGLYALYSIAVAVYRLTFHPLAKFPGPFLCRISYLQQCYYEAVLNGKLLQKLPEYHQKYGMLDYHELNRL